MEDNKIVQFSMKKVVKIAVCFLLISVCLWGYLQSVGNDGNAYEVYAYVPVDKYVACYIKVDEYYMEQNGFKNLEERVGEKYWQAGRIFEGIYEKYDKATIADDFSSSENCTWYKVNRYNNIKYLIRKAETGELTLWEFDKFYNYESEDIRSAFPEAILVPFEYSVVLQLVYNVKGAEQIERICVLPDSRDNSHIGLEYQEKIGTVYITDSEDIAFFYQVISNMKNEAVMADGSYGGRVRSKVIEETLNKDKLDNISKAYSRFLRLELIDGTTIDNLIYSAVEGRFYQYGQVIYNEIEDDVWRKMNELLVIENEEIGNKCE